MKAVLALLGTVLLVAVAHSDPAGKGAWRSMSNDPVTSWRGWKSERFPDGWQRTGDTLSKEGEVDDLVTRETFGNFELELEWKIGQGGNSGIFYRGTREYDHIYWSAPEYQLLDDANAPDGKDRLTSAATAYALYPASAGVVKPFDKWNSTRIVVNGAHVEHWLNGQRVVSYELWSPDLDSQVAASKFAKYPNYGFAQQGYIAIQGDHPDVEPPQHPYTRITLKARAAPE